jgi:RES domain
VPVNPGLTVTIDAGTPFFRITSPAFYITNSVDHRKVVNGEGAVKSQIGARYNYPGVRTIYLTEDLESCFAERLFYFHREVLRGLDLLRYPTPIPPFQRNSVLWEIQFDYDLTDVFDARIPGAPSYFNIFPSLMVNPSQDYEHLKQRRADIQSNGYKGLRAPSSRSRRGGNLIILFDDQSSHIQSIIPHEVEFRLITVQGGPFINHAQDLLDFTVGEVRMPWAQPTGGAAYQNWQRVEFNH